MGRGTGSDAPLGASRGDSAQCDCAQRHNAWWTNGDGVSNEGHAVTCPFNPQLIAHAAKGPQVVDPRSFDLEKKRLQLQETGEVYLRGATLAEAFQIVNDLGIDPRKVKLSSLKLTVVKTDDGYPDDNPMSRLDALQGRMDSADSAEERAAIGREIFELRNGL